MLFHSFWYPTCFASRFTFSYTICFLNQHSRTTDLYVAVDRDQSTSVHVVVATIYRVTALSLGIIAFWTGFKVHCKSIKMLLHLTLEAPCRAPSYGDDTETTRHVSSLMEEEFLEGFNHCRPRLMRNIRVNVRWSRCLSHKQLVKLEATNQIFKTSYFIT